MSVKHQNSPFSVSNAEVSFANKIQEIAYKEAKKRGLKPKTYTGAFAGDSYVFEIQFENQLRADTVCEGKA